MKCKFLNLNLVLSYIFVIIIIILCINAHRNTRLNGLKVEFLNHNPGFINNDIIKNIINYDRIFNCNMREINNFELETKLVNNPYINSADVYKTLNGYLKIRIIFNHPIARLKKFNKEYYLSDSGVEMPLSKINTSNVILLQGNINYNDYEKIINFIKYIKNDVLFKNNIIAIRKNILNSYYELILNVDYYYIELGTLDDFEEKMKNLKLFYNQHLCYVDKTYYKKISLIFKDRIIGVKR